MITCTMTRQCVTCKKLLVNLETKVIVHILDIYILVTPKCVLWKTVKNQMKCRLLQLSSGSTLFIKTKTIFRERNPIFLKIITCEPSNYTMDHPKFIISTQKLDSISV